MAADTPFSISINGTCYVVNTGKYGPSTPLVEFIRNEAHLKGTKVVCQEGGCGACLVVVSDGGGKGTGRSVNSCLYPLYACQGKSITTVEGIGGVNEGYHPIQKKLADGNGSQCGFCSPGMVMNMFGLLKNGKQLSKEQIEASFDGNICRCTGYRPIMAAMKQFSDDKDSWAVPDIEDLGKKKCSRSSYRVVDGDVWIDVTNLQELKNAVKRYAETAYQLVCGNTGKGVFKKDTYESYLNIGGMAELKQHVVSETSVSVGAAVTLTDLVDLFSSLSQRNGFGYFQAMVDHILIVANISVRNVASWAGNLMLKHKHRGFPSDLFCLFNAVGAMLTICDCSSDQVMEVSVEDFLSMSMKGKVLLSVSFSQLENFTLHSNKIRPRVQNAHAYVNAAFLIPHNAMSYQVTGVPRIAFGGVSSTFTRATQTETYLSNRNLLDNETLQESLSILSKELIFDSGPLLPSVGYRQNLCQSLLYKTFLAITEGSAAAAVSSGGAKLKRSVLTSEDYEYHVDDPSRIMGKDLTKLDAVKQAAGEAEFVDDIPVSNALHASFVLSTVGNAEIEQVDGTSASSVPGFVRLLTAKDIPGRNCFLDYTEKGGSEEELLCTDRSEYAGQPVAIVVCESKEAAETASKVVKVTYKNQQKPILSIQEAMEAKSFFKDPETIVYGDAAEAMAAADHVITGSASAGEQYHFHMETLNALVVPVEGSYDVYSSTQWISGVQTAISDVLDIPASRISMKTRRVGGGFGAKTTRPNMVGAAAALAAYYCRRPVKMVLNLETNMLAIGKRQAISADYKVGVTKEGKLVAIEMNAYQDCGHCLNENSFNIPDMIFPIFLDSGYSCENWLIKMRNCRTNKPAHCFFRGPGTSQAILFVETIMEHLAHELKRDGLELRKVNFYKKGEICKPVTLMPLNYFVLDDMLDEFTAEVNLEKKIETVHQFNKDNLWIKKGLSVVPMKYPSITAGLPFSVCVTIYQSDGSVSVAHGGIDIGQGVNTKVAQVCADTLGIPLNLVTIEPTNSLTSGNSVPTGGSYTSILNCLAVYKCCQELLQRMAPLRKTGQTWQELIKACFSKHVPLIATLCHVTGDDGTGLCYLYAVVCAEVTVDVLTGEFCIDSMALNYDIGKSLNPKLDLGQIEGAMAMGVGMMCHEKIVYDQTTGENLTVGTWNYKPPLPGDIPGYFKIKLIQDRPNPLKVVRAKAVGEPPLALSCSVIFALRKAIQNFLDRDSETGFHAVAAPLTVENIHQACQVDPKTFYMK